MSTTWRHGKKEHLFFTEHLPVAASGYSIYFLLELKRVDCATEEEENKILQKDVEEKSNNIVQNQEQVAVSSIASVVKPFTSSCSSGKIEY